MPTARCSWRRFRAPRATPRQANGDGRARWPCACQAGSQEPREIAQIIVDHIPKTTIASVEIAGPGFINIRLSDAVLQGVVREVREEGDNFGRGTIPEGERYVNLEYVSANPTGPFHVGHGRWASLGDAMARVMRHGGYDVYEEYYINDHGNQMDVFGNSVNVRYQQLLGRDVEMPEACYGGAYVKDIAQDIIDRDGDKWLNVSDEERVEAFREMAYDMTLKNQREVLATSAPPSTSGSPSARCTWRTRTARAPCPAPWTPCARRATSTRRTAPCGSARRIWATTGIACSSRATARPPTS
ncbi:MAG: arginine--tRNA ligase [Coriobacteriaceae bacterium]